MLAAGDGIAISGSGSPTNPYVITAGGGLSCEGIQDCIGSGLGQGLTYDDALNRIRAFTSLDGPNLATFGGDGGIYVPTTITSDLTLSSSRLDINRALAADPALRVKLTADAQQRLIISADGKHLWGSGAAVGDTTLYRSNVAELTTDGKFVVGGDLQVNGIGQLRTIVKGANESIASSTVLQDDDALLVSVVANAKYDVLAMIMGDGPAAGDFKTAWTVPAGATGLRACWGPTPDAKATLTPGFDNRTNTAMRSGCHGWTTATPYSNQAISSGIAIQERGVLSTAATAGTLRLQWAQNTSDVGLTTVYGESYIMIRRIA
ncbi:hypothetical protein [Nonomuraea sp. NEAU-A123]|uniref:hypothetical protein n=1 Tax=Nonomuraea sp. NEAU-A123 TaxID=2839649 RepID=UPI001BE4C707|nr:hypothetical protein [Nonomuraea sp. NEAU-A123]MBT2226239.1 hypothetical protein [Nonomuraea sp. NEAU-A123]